MQELKKNKINNKIISFLWIVATVTEWINVILFIAAMGYNFIEIPLYNNLKNWEYVVPLFCILATIDALIFWFLSLIHKNNRETKNTLIAVWCSLVQIMLLIWKICFMKQDIIVQW